MPVLLVLSHTCAVQVMRRLPSSWRKYAQTSSWDKPLWCVSLVVYEPIEWAADVESATEVDLRE